MPDPRASAAVSAPAGPMAEARARLNRVFGFSDFRPGQAAVVNAVLAGRDVLTVMPTGSGKSLCFQLPALLRAGPTVVVSPLIALMRDQVRQLTAFGIAAATWNSANDWRENAEIADRLRAGALDLLYVAPERLVRPDTIDRLLEAGVSLLAIDEAHCVSQWGHDFRPEYLGLGEVRRALGGVQTIALTATADPPTRADILDRLFEGPPAVFVSSFDRPNLHLAMRPKASATRQLLAFLDGHRGRSGIVYAASRKRTEQLAEAFRGAGHAALAYHAGLAPEVRSAAQDRFQAEDGVVIAATVAFGMGIDKPDVRFVAHADLPASIEAYYQEIGRAGRDGLPADTLTLYGLDDMRFRRVQIDDGDAPAARKRIEHQRLTALLALAEAPRCRRQTLLGYFGEPVPDPCGRCDLCCDGVDGYDGTIPAQKAMSAILRTGERFATEHLIAVLTGQETEKVAAHGHQRLPTFGVGADQPPAVWRGIFRQLYAAGLLEMDLMGYGRWSITEAGRRVLRGQEAIALRRDRPAVSAPKAAGRRGKAAPAAPDALRAPADAALLERLKAKRLALARAAGVPAYVVFPDRTLIEMAAAKPRTQEALAGLHGVGEAKLARYGAAFLAVIASGPDATDR